MSDERMYFHDDEELGITRNDNDKENVERHVSRYRFASQFVKEGNVVLDCACGIGYGSEILAKKAKKVIGVDIDEKTIRYAKKHYQHQNIEFIQQDLFKVDYPPETFDIVVSVETLEHVKDCTPYLKKVYSMLKKGGIAVLSTPMLRYKDGKPYVTNPFHENEMPREVFLSIIRGIFDDAEFFAQHQADFPALTIENTGFCIAVCRKK